MNKRQAKKWSKKLVKHLASLADNSYLEMQCVLYGHMPRMIDGEKYV